MEMSGNPLMSFSHQEKRGAMLELSDVRHVEMGGFEGEDVTLPSPPAPPLPLPQRHASEGTELALEDELRETDVVYGDNPSGSSLDLMMSGHS